MFGKSTLLWGLFSLVIVIVSVVIFWLETRAIAREFMRRAATMVTMLEKNVKDTTHSYEASMDRSLDRMESLMNRGPDTGAAIKAVGDKPTPPPAPKRPVRKPTTLA